MALLLLFFVVCEIILNLFLSNFFPEKLGIFAALYCLPYGYQNKIKTIECKKSLFLYTWGPLQFADNIKLELEMLRSVSHSLSLFSI